MTLLQPPSRPIKIFFYFPLLENTPTTTSDGHQSCHMTRLWIFLAEQQKKKETKNKLIHSRPAGRSQQSFSLLHKSLTDLKNSDISGNLV